MKIAIDGPAASGKTSLGKALAREFGLRFVETGKMYRAVALAYDREIPLERIDIVVTLDERFLLNDEDVTDLLHTPEMDQKSSRVATLPEVRRRMVELQRTMAGRYDVVMEGRDIGTVVLPDADVKIFLEATPRVRALRRVQQRGELDASRVEQELIVRDKRDSERSIAPLKPASDATIIQTDQKPLEEVISVASSLVRDRLGNVARSAEKRD